MYLQSDESYKTTNLTFEFYHLSHAERGKDMFYSMSIDWGALGSGEAAGG